MKKLIPLAMLPLVAVMACTLASPSPTPRGEATPRQGDQAIIRVEGSPLEKLVALPHQYDEINKMRMEFVDNRPVRVYLGNLPPQNVYTFSIPEVGIASISCLQRTADGFAMTNDGVLAYPIGIRLPEIDADAAVVLELRAFTGMDLFEFDRHYGKVIPALFEGCYCTHAY